MTHTVHVHFDHKGIATINFNHPKQKTNVINEDFINDLNTALDNIFRQKPKGIILTSSKSTFVAGADLHFIGTLIHSKEPVKQLTTCIRSIHQTFLRLEQANIPVVSAINGSALGGGFELTLATHHRIALNQPTIKIGLPEIKLGILPGLGGSIRTCRLLGYQQGLTLLLKGVVLSPQKALQSGWIDGIAQDDEDLRAKAIEWINNNPSPEQPWYNNQNKTQEMPFTPQGNLTWIAANSLTLKRSFGCYPNLTDLLQACYESSFLSFDQALEAEMRFFIKAALRPQASCMLKTYFTDKQKLKKGLQRPHALNKNINSILICGTGFMGQGIAKEAIKSGLKVWLLDQNEQLAQEAKQNIIRALENDVNQNKLSNSQIQHAQNWLKPVSVIDNIPSVDLIIEAVTESANIKKALYQSLQPIMTPETILATNTSTIPIDQLCADLPSPSQFIGIHFFSPVDKMELVEIIQGSQTSDTVTAHAFDWVNQLKKTPIIVKDGRGFFTTRVVMSYVDEGLRMLHEGHAIPAIERAGKQQGMPVGPISLLDEIGIDVADQIHTQTASDVQSIDSDSAAPSIIKTMTQKERLGRKNGKGFYDYPEYSPKKLWSELPHPTVDLSESVYQQMQERLIYRQLAEICNAVEDGVIEHAAIINIGAVFGWGFCPWSGGPIHWVHLQGTNYVIEKSKELSINLGQRFSINPKTLQQLTQELL